MSKKPNVILLTIDSMRADHLSCYGYFNDVSPNINRLASEGTLFLQAISNGDATPSSFPSIITSTYPSLHPTKKAFGVNPIFLSSNRTTIAEVLKKHGYSTAAFIAKNPFLFSFCHYDRGFDVFDDQVTMMDQFDRSSKSKVHHKILHGLTRPMQYFNWHIAEPMKYILGITTNSANAINKKAISWLRKNKSSFFLWLHYMDVHMPYNSSSLVERIIAWTLDNKRRSRLRSGRYLLRHELKMWVNIYDNAIKYVDHQVAWFLRELEKEGISCDNSYIVLLADHGEQFMEHGWIGHGSLYDEVLHVPLIVCGPGIEKKIVIKDPVPLLDVSPTIVDLLHIPKVKTFQGRSLVPLINGRNDTRNIISEGSNPNDKSMLFSFRTEEWKYIRCLDKGKRILKEEFYNLHRDPREKENLIEIEKTKAEEFRLKILSHIAMEERERVKTSEARGPEVHRVKDEREIKERLRHLGYI